MFCKDPRWRKFQNVYLLPIQYATDATSKLRQPEATFTHHNSGMAKFQFASSRVGGFLSRVFGPTRLVLFGVFVVVLLFCMVFIWTTRGAMANFSFLRQDGGASGTIGEQKTLVDQSPWKTAQALAPLAVSAEETEFARSAERLAGHEVDQAFAAALRQANLQAERRNLTGDALPLSEKVDQLRQSGKGHQA